MNRSGVVQGVGGLPLLEMVSRYHQVMSNPNLFQEVRNGLDAKLASVDAKSKELDEKQVRLNTAQADCDARRRKACNIQ